MEKNEKTLFAPLSAPAQNIWPEKHLHIGNKTCILLETPSCWAAGGLAFVQVILMFICFLVGIFKAICYLISHSTFSGANKDQRNEPA